MARKTIFVGYLPTSRQYCLYDPATKEVLVSTVPKFAEDEFWSWSDEPEELGVDVESLDPIEPVDFDLNELLGTHVEQESRGSRHESEELQVQDQPQEAARDVVRAPERTVDEPRPQEEAADNLRSQEAIEEGFTDDTDSDTIVVDTSSSVKACNDP